MAFKIPKLPFPCVPCFCVILLLLICLSLCCSHAKSHITNSTPSEGLDNSLLPSLMNTPGEREPTFLPGLLGSYLKNSSLALNLSDTTAFYLPELRPGSMAFGVSFSIDFTVNIRLLSNQAKAKSSLVFAIHQIDPAVVDCGDDSSMYLCSSLAYEPTKDAASTAAASNVSAQISSLVNGAFLILIQFDIDPPENYSSVVNSYRVKISYINSRRRMSVGVTGDGVRQPVNAEEKIQRSMPHPTMMSASIGFFSSRGQLVELDRWNWKALEVQDQSVSPFLGFDPYHVDQSSNPNVIILSSVFGSAAAVAITVAVVYFYLNSKYRRWRAEQDKLSKIMQNLPGVPTQIDYTDIKKATKNFDQTMRLGKGGFGAVYRCTLPPSASRTGHAMEVAVKKFVREVEHRRYDDFLAEVSIINRLRHKNIVPLIGWSYNKGEPILIYEYMTNGSLDQHLFMKGGTGHRQQQQEEASIGKWQTRYSIAKDIAIGLHYVHHDHEPMVLHRDIKASNIMLDTTFRARLGDFGIASTVAVDRSSVTGIAGTWGYIAPEYAMTYRSTRQTDTYAFGVLILEVITGKKNGNVPPHDDHITDWIWRLHREGKLLEAVDIGVLAAEGVQQDDIIDEAERLLLLGLACTNPNPSNRPSMVEAVQVITKLAPPPDVPLERPTFMWPPEDWRLKNSVYSTALSDCDRISGSTFEISQVSQEHPPASATGGHAFVSTMASASYEGTMTLSHSDETEQSV